MFEDIAPILKLTKKFKGFIYVDKDYIAIDIFKALYKRGLKLITEIRKNMKNYLISLLDKKLYRKRFYIKTIFEFLKKFYEFRTYYRLIFYQFFT